LTNLPTEVRDKVRSRSDRALADLLLNPNSVGSAEMANILSAAQQAPSVVRGAAPANAISSLSE
jgi:hypothetical protein